MFMVNYSTERWQTVEHWSSGKETLRVFFSGFWIIAENKLCNQCKFMILTRCVHHDTLFKLAQVY